LKTRHLITYGDYELELDIYSGDLQGMITLECEFPSREEARSFTLPPVFSQALEVTDDFRYKNKYLAEQGMPSRGSSHGV
jgi:CYTH domain-containing protein